MMYDFCKRCGAPHDDGTADYCFNCLDELYNFDDDYQELEVSDNIDCATGSF